MKKIISVTVLIIVLVSLFLWWDYKDSQESGPVITVTDFDECAAQGYPVMESYPRQCRTPNGRLFVEDIGNELEKTDLIRVSKPRPNELVIVPSRLKGRPGDIGFLRLTFLLRYLMKMVKS